MNKVHETKKTELIEEPNSKEKAEIKKFRISIIEVFVLFSHSNTQGLAVFESMLLYNENPKIFDDFIEYIKFDQNIKSGIKDQIIENLIKNLEFIRFNLKIGEKWAFDIVKEIKNKAIDFIDSFL